MFLSILFSSHNSSHTKNFAFFFRLHSGPFYVIVRIPVTSDIDLVTSTANGTRTPEEDCQGVLEKAGAHKASHDKELNMFEK